MNHQWPIYNKVEDARCFQHPDTPLERCHMNYLYAKGQGDYSGLCPLCGMTTFFDLASTMDKQC